ncbi:MAG: histidinol-phosphatase [Rhodospirillaceae bacterium]|nr:histidinol-phosphatase [Rhodospirillaceae bacterium]|tara:strand:- start:3292 stop:4107 length:816 start_codon:yes stop_codon:yes gene_type:complete
MANIYNQIDLDIESYLNFTHQIADVASNVIKPLFRSNLEITDKGDKENRLSQVTEADRGAERAMRSLIEEKFPQHGIIGEEYGYTRSQSKYVWVLDPIDGTDPFLAGLPTWGSLIALMIDGRSCIGMMNQPIFGERFYGSKNGAFLGPKRISTRKCKNLKDASLSITSLQMLANKSQLDAFKEIEKRVLQLRVGGDCYNYALLAAGSIDLVIEGQLAPWDIQAHIPIIEAAGGIITDWKGNEIKAGGWVIAAGDPYIHEQALEFLSLANTE